MKKVHLLSRIASRRSAILLYCLVVGLGIVSASAQAVDGVSGASTRVLAPADTLISIDSTYMEVRSPCRTIENTGDAPTLSRAAKEERSQCRTIENPATTDSTFLETGKKQARKRTVTVQAEVPEPSPKKGRLTIGGYGEAAMKRCFYSNNYLRYTSPENYTNDQYGEFDLPHVVFYLGYDFGKMIYLKRHL